MKTTFYGCDNPVCTEICSGATPDEWWGAIIYPRAADCEGGMMFTFGPSDRKHPVRVLACSPECLVHAFVARLAGAVDD